MPRSIDNLSPWSVHRAFVVQFRAETDTEQGQWVGQVEHVASGQETPFHSLADLLAFFARVLAQTPRAGSEELPQDH